MQKNAVPEQLLVLREQIDVLDEELLNVLSKRFQITAQVGKLKAEQGLESLDEQREANKLKQLQEKALSKNLNPEFIAELFQQIFSEVVTNHKSYRN